MTDKLIAFGYYGGKYSHLDWLLPLLPTQGITHYCEPFGGSGAVLLNREPSPVETYNDLDGELANFFKVLREQTDEIIRQLAFTPFSRSEYVLSCGAPDGLSEVERARRLFVRIVQGFAQIPNGTPGRWGYVITQSRNDMGGRVSSFYNKLDGLGAIAKRLLRVQIESMPAMDLLERYDNEDTLFYVDPPYSPDICYVGMAYRHVMTIDQHRELITKIISCKGKVALSGYDSPTYTEMLKDWHITRAPYKNIASASGKDRQEVLWTNYDPAAIHSVTDLPLFAARPA
jgi:DNA adenine methylase